MKNFFNNYKSEYLFQFFIILTSIIIGYYFTVYIENQKENDLTKKLLTQLKSELTTNNRKLHEYHQRLNDNLIVLKSVIKSKGRGNLNYAYPTMLNFAWKRAISFHSINLLETQFLEQLGYSYDAQIDLDNFIKIHLSVGSVSANIASGSNKKNKWLFKREINFTQNLIKKCRYVISMNEASILEINKYLKL